jgi:hypothetical protein
MCVTGKRLKCTLTSGREDSIEQVSGSRLVLDEGTRMPSLIGVIFAFLGGVCVGLKCCTCRESGCIYVRASMGSKVAAGRPASEWVVASPTVIATANHASWPIDRRGVWLLSIGIGFRSHLHECHVEAGVHGSCRYLWGG